MHLQEKGLCWNPAFPKNGKFWKCCLAVSSLAACGHTALPKSCHFSWHLPDFFPAWMSLVQFGFTLACFGFFPQRKTPQQTFCKIFIVSVSISQEKSLFFHRSGGRQVETQVELECNIICGCTDPASVSTWELTLGLVTSKVLRKCFYINFPCVVLFPRDNI